MTDGFSIQDLVASFRSLEKEKSDFVSLSESKSPATEQAAAELIGRWVVFPEDDMPFCRHDMGEEVAFTQFSFVPWVSNCLGGRLYPWLKRHDPLTASLFQKNALVAAIKTRGELCDGLCAREIMPCIERVFGADAIDMLKAIDAVPRHSEYE